MADQFVIKPDNRSLTVFKGILEIPFSFPVSALFEEAYIQEILVNTSASSWEITLLVKDELTPEQISELEQALAALVLGLSKVKIKAVYRKNLSPLNERLDRNWDQIVAAASVKFAGINGWLTEAGRNIQGEKGLEILVRNKAGVEYLMQRRDELRDIIRDFVHEELTLSFTVGEFDDKTGIDEMNPNSVDDTPAPVSKKPKTGHSTRAGEIIYGKKFDGQAIPIKQLNMEQQQVVLCGQIFRLESRIAKNNKKFYLGDITDFEDSIGFKIFPRGDTSPNEHLKEGNWVKMRGNVQFDPYSKELTMLVSDIMGFAPLLAREDLADQKRVELHLHTKMSAMDATVDVGAAIKQAVRWGHPALAITDHGVVQAFPEAYAVAQETGIKIIYGMEGYLVDDGTPLVIGASEERIRDSVFVVFDLETTGLNPWKEDLLEIGAVKIENGQIIEQFQSLIRPDREISSEIEKLTGINFDLVKDAPGPEQVIKAFLEFASGAVLVAHNAEFDVGFMKAKLQALFNLKLQLVYLDTLGLSRTLWPNLKSYRLNAVAKELGIELTGHHRAMADAQCTAAILRKALEKIAERNLDRLIDLNSLVTERGVEHLKTYHLTILAKTQVGIKNLYRLTSDAHIRYFHRHPRIPKSELVKFREGLLIGTACESGELYQAVLDGDSEEKLIDIANFYDYLEIMPLENNRFLIDSGRVKSTAELIEINRRIYDIGVKLGKTVVATGDVHFLDPHEEIYRRILQLGQGYEGADIQAPLYFQTTDEMLREFSYFGPEIAEQLVITNSRILAERIEDVKPIPSRFCPPQIPGAEEEIREMSFRRATELYGDPLPPIVKERLDWELESIIGHGYAVLYLTAQKLVKKSLDDGYLVGSRGSVGSSFVATMCGITEVNPLPPHYYCSKCRFSEFQEIGDLRSGYDLPSKNCPQCGHPLTKEGQDIPFATFMGFEGDKEPDIDLNFSGEYQPVVHRYTEELFGKGNVFRAGTITGLAEKMAFGFVKGFMEAKGIRLRQAEINRLVKGCTGVRRSTGQHPGGMYVLPKDQEIYNFTPIQYPANDKKAEWITTHFDYHGALEGRLVKLDILGHDDPTVIRMLHDLTGIDPRSVPMDDSRTIKIFSSVESLGITAEVLGFNLGTLGIPEFGTGFVRQMLEETRPTTFSELIYISGLSHGTNVWLGNAQELIKNKLATLSEVISTRDDIMNYLIFKGLPPKTSFKIMEKVRKGKGLDQDDIQIMKEHRIPDWYIESCLKIKYMFPKAHAVAYVMSAFRIGYFKVNYPEAFYATYFSVRADEFEAEIVIGGERAVKTALEKIRLKGNEATQREKNLETILDMVLEAMLRGIRFLRVDIYKSDPHKFLITPEGLLPPLASLQGLGDNAAKYLAAARAEGRFISIEDLKNRARLSSAVIEVLQKHGCLEGMSESDQLTLFIL
jgi:DNA polymerase III subunit alpha, Gram-positive type